jgi:hypothetical protein
VKLKKELTEPKTYCQELRRKHFLSLHQRQKMLEVTIVIISAMGINSLANKLFVFLHSDFKYYLIHIIIHIMCGTLCILYTKPPDHTSIFSRYVQYNTDMIVSINFTHNHYLHQQNSSIQYSNFSQNSSVPQNPYHHCHQHQLKY